jgi:hypothetical protein
MTKAAIVTMSSGTAAVGAATGRSTARHGATTKSARQVDPALRRAVAAHALGDPLTVMVKLDSKQSAFAKHPVSNRPGNKREKVFSQEVHEIVRDAGAVATAGYRIVSAASNVGVATVVVPTEVVKGLMRSGRIAGMKLKSG